MDGFSDTANPQYFDVWLMGLDSSQTSKISFIKALRKVTVLGLREAKDVVENTPSILFTHVKKNEMSEVVANLREAGGIIKFVAHGTEP